MRRLRERPRIDTLANDVRRGRSNWTRTVYVGILLLCSLWLGDYLLGPYLYLRSEGMVLAPSVTMATEHTATIRNMYVQEGERVSVGQRIASLTSQDVAESIARLSIDLATLKARESELKARYARAQALLQLASDRSRMAKETRQRYDVLQHQGLLPSDKLNATIDSEYRSLSDVEALRAEVRAFDEQLAGLSFAIGKAEQAQGDLETTYGRGQIAAPFDGVIGRRYVESGTVVTAGAPLVDVYTDAKYILAYLPTGTLYDSAVGDSVTIDWGVRHVHGVITAVEPVATVLPKEFQTAFKPVARNQVIRIGIASDDPASQPPLFSKVHVRSHIVLDEMIAWARSAGRQAWTVAMAMPARLTN